MLETAATGCAACGGRLRAGALFCPACGRSVTATDAPTVAAPAAGALPRGEKLENDRGAIARAATLFLLLLASFLVLGWISRAGNDSPWPEVVTGLVDLAIVLGFAAARYRDILPLLRPPRTNSAMAVMLAVLSVVFIVAMFGYFAVVEGLGMKLLSASDDLVKAGWSLGQILLVVAVLPAVTEELAMRGVIQSSLEQVVSGREAWIIQAALFSVLHLLPGMFPSHFMMGLFFGYLRNKTRSLYPGMALHATWNALVILQEMW